MSGDNGNQPIVGSVVFSPGVKLLLERYFPATLAEISGLMEHGATTHPHDMEWKDHTVEDHLAHARAHLTQYLTGNHVDKESGSNQLIHVVTRLLMANEMRIDEG